MTSPPARVPSAHQVVRLIVFLMNLTEPSPRPRFTPPGWLLVGFAVLQMPNPDIFETSLVLAQEIVFGAPKWL